MKVALTCRSNKGSIVEKFYNNNHVQGNVPGCEVFYLTINEEVVAAMSFSKVTSERGAKSRERYELRRFATCCSVVGGASKLLKAFTRTHPNFTEIISYSDTRLFSGGMYETIGFDLVKKSPPDYSYTRGNVVEHKSRFQHSRMKVREGFAYDPNLTELENCTNNGWFRIWDCGKKKWSLKP